MACLFQYNTGYIFSQTSWLIIQSVYFVQIWCSGEAFLPVSRQNGGDVPAELLSGFGPKTLNMADKSTNRVDLSVTSTVWTDGRGSRVISCWSGLYCQRFRAAAVNTGGGFKQDERRENRKNFVKMEATKSHKSDVWLTVHRNSVWIRKTN